MGQDALNETPWRVIVVLRQTNLFLPSLAIKYTLYTAIIYLGKVRKIVVPLS